MELNLRCPHTNYIYLRRQFNLDFSLPIINFSVKKSAEIDHIGDIKCEINNVKLFDKTQ